ncbi:MAG: penicillin-binding transpeptidase domain-containing protein [Actinomycetota bacterium]|nr:penicillin-binding transpeptidase domain-containing protein [Actinomycetota bacterium]MDQ2956779.1 penicillin-binding transpeptidase domain-containing protein [Actinomycetota bacterium]
MRHATSSRSVQLLGVLALVAVALTACGHSKKLPPEQVAAQAYLTALGSADASGASAATTAAGPAATAIAKSLTGLGSGIRGSLTVTGLTNRQSSSATVNYDASWTLPGVATPWKYSGSLPLVKQGKNWLVSWSTADIQPQLPSGSHLSVQRSQPTRAAVTDDKGVALFAPTEVVTVGIDTGTVADLPSLAKALAVVPQLQTTAAEISTAVKAAGKNQFVPVITLRRSAYEQIKPLIYNLKGTKFNTDTMLLPPTSGFARQLLGTVGPATKELIDGSKGRIADGDQVGLSGLQRALDPQLGGTAGVAVYAASDSADTPGVKLGAFSAPVAGKPVQLTLDSRTQEAADAALASITLPAAVVVTQPSTGKILAVANSSAANDDIALVGQYPAGSTFKIVTYTAEFEAHPTHDPTTTAACPATVTVDGRVFHNENFSHGTIPYSAAFGYSCNTTAINVADGLPDGTMYKAAQQLGLGAKWNLPVDSFAGSMPATATGTEKAAEAIGQGKVLVSPLLMAEIAGASATGKPVAPSLVVGQQATASPTLDSTVTTKMNVLLRATVAMPGATAYLSLNGLPGEIRGKTGTAEFGTDVPPKSHSWFAGTRGDLAVSVFIYGGEQPPPARWWLRRTSSPRCRNSADA